MAQYYEDFRAASGVPSEFSVVWHGPITLSIGTGNSLPDSDKHLLLTPSDATFARSALKWDVGVTSGITTVLCLVDCIFSESTNTRTIPGPLLSGSGTGATRTGYVYWAMHRISRYTSGSDSTLFTGTTELPGTGVYWLELRRNGASLEARRWPYGDSRPGSALLSVTDGSPLAEAGFFGYSFLSSVLQQPGKLYSISAGTDGDPAPTEPVGGARRRSPLLLTPW